MSRIRDVVPHVGVFPVALLVLVTYTLPVHAAYQTSSQAEVIADPALEQIDDEFEFEEEAIGFPDPLEGLNRRTLRLNQHLDRWIVDPVTEVYAFVVPDAGRRAVRRVLANLNSPSVLVNDMLQLEWKRAQITVTRFVLNTTVGLAGIFDPANRLGMEGHKSDFGQTLARGGVSSGPFLMLPAFGPTTARDGLGILIDALFRPTTYILGPGDQVVYTTIHGGTAGIAARDANGEEIRILQESSADYYAVLRNAYYQHRMAQIQSGH